MTAPAQAEQPVAELLPCPFCGGADIRFDCHRATDRGDVWSMCCYNCGATFPNRYERELLVAAWNRRPSAWVDAGEPIESAPKKGKILLWWPLAEAWITGYWETDEYAKKPRPYWTSERGYMGVMWHRQSQPTHWYELPTPPSAGRGQG